MNRLIALVVALVLLVSVGCISVVLVVSFHGNDTQILVAAIIGFLAPTVASLLTLLQAAANAEKTAAVSTQVADVNRKVDGHLTRLTQIVVDSAAKNEPISPTDAAALASHTTALTGNVVVPPEVKPT